MATWPGTLPAPQLSSYHNSDLLPVLKTEMESGPPRRTRYSAHYMTKGQITMTLDPTQLAAFRQLMSDSNHGTDWITGTPVDTGGGLVNHRIRITSVQRKVLLPPDKLWNVTIAFETDEHL